MTSQRPLWRMASLFVAGLIVLSAGSAIAAAAERGSSAETDDTTTIGSFDVEIEDEVFIVSDVHVSGDGLPDESIDERSYTVHDATFHTDGLVFTVNGERYQICELSITVDNVGLTVQDVRVEGS